MEPRQGSYYISVAKYLGVIDNSDKNGKYVITPQGFMLNNLDMKTSNETLIKEILKHKVFYYSYKYYLDNNEMFIISLMKKIYRPF